MLNREVRKSNTDPLECKIALAVLMWSLTMIGVIVGREIEIATHPSRDATLCDWEIVNVSPLPGTGSGLTLYSQRITASHCESELVWR